MKDKIKQILEDIDNKECYYVGTNGCLYQDLTKKQLLLIKNYITNLQYKINNSIKYIEKEFCQIDRETGELECWHSNVKPILDILQGEDK